MIAVHILVMLDISITVLRSILNRIYAGFFLCTFSRGSVQLFDLIYFSCKVGNTNDTWSCFAVTYFVVEYGVASFSGTFNLLMLTFSKNSVFSVKRIGRFGCNSFKIWTPHQVFFHEYCFYWTSTEPNQ